MTARDAHDARRRHAAPPRERSRPPAGAKRYASAAELARPAAQSPARRPPVSLLLRFLRYGLPGTIVLAGAVTMCFATAPALIGGSALIGAGLATALVSWFYRIGVESDSVRDEEDRARSYFERYGRWPDGRP